MEDYEQLNCVVDRAEIPGSDFIANAASVVLGATMCFSAPFPRPGTEMIDADSSKIVFDAPFEDQHLQPPGFNTINVRQDISFDCSPISNHLEGLVTNLSMPKNWYNEGVDPPSDACKTYSRQVLRRLFDTYGIIPYKITVSKDGGVFAAYKSANTKNILRIEVDNELDVVAVVTDGSSILDSGLLEEDDREQSLIAALNRSVA